MLNRASINYLKNILRFLVVVLLFWALWRLLDSKISLEEFQNSWRSLSQIDTILILFSFLLMPINWGLEAFKWQLLVKPISPIAYKNAYKAILLGATLGNLTPLMIGDYVGRTSFLPSEKRILASGALLYGHGIQTMVLLLLAWVACPFLAESLQGENNILPILWVALSLLLLVGVLFYSKYLFFDFLSKIVPFNLLELYNFKIISRLTLISILRQLLYTFQFLLLLFVFKIKLELLTLLSLISFVFLFKTIGSFAGVLGDMLGRQLSAVYFFNFFYISIENVILASTFLWFINLFLPMLIGILFVNVFSNKGSFEKI